MIRPRGLGITALVAVGAAAVVTLTAPAATASGATQRHRPVLTHRSTSPYALGETQVTTNKGIAPALIGAGILPLPAANTGFRISDQGGLRATYRFPITSNTANLGSGTGDILHAGGIRFVSATAKLEIGRFDIDLAAGKVFATVVNGAAARVPILDLDLSGLQVGQDNKATALTGIAVSLDQAAADALNATFGTQLPGGLPFGTARVVIR